MQKLPMSITFAVVFLYAFFRYTTVGIFDVYIPLLTILLIMALCSINPPDYSAEKSITTFWWIMSVAVSIIYGLNIISDLYYFF